MPPYTEINKKIDIVCEMPSSSWALVAAEA